MLNLSGSETGLNTFQIAQKVKVVQKVRMNVMNDCELYNVGKTRIDFSTFYFPTKTWSPFARSNVIAL